MERSAQQVVALTSRCGCGGTYLPEPATLHLDADGTAVVDTTCSRCGSRSCVFFTWDAPAEWS